jgi:choline-sulfatase/uncharacterized sulfatase
MEKAPGVCSDAITRIPFIWRWQGHFTAAHVAREIVETVDLSATICSLAGLDPLQTSDGRDLTKLLHGQHEIVHRVGVTEFAWSKSIRKDRFRYVHYPVDMFSDEYPDGFGELYDLEEDPWEMQNLYFRQEYGHTVDEMRRELLDWVITTTRPSTNLGMDVFAGPQSITRYRCATNRDGKFSPDKLRHVRTKNYL